MAKPSKRPSEFPTDWHFQNHLENLEREIQGRKVILEGFEASPKGTADRELNIERTKLELEAAREQLEHYSGHKGASKRPARAASTR
jgi:hypothetical protein